MRIKRGLEKDIEIGKVDGKEERKCMKDGEGKKKGRKKIVDV